MAKSATFFQLTISILISILLLTFISCDKNGSASLIKLSGTVEVDRIKISPLIGGKIINLPIEEGKKISKNSLVANIDCRELQTNLKQAEASLKAVTAKFKLIKSGFRKEDILQADKAVEQAKISMDKASLDFGRAKTLYESGNIPEQTFNDAKSQFDIAKSRMAAAEEQYNKLSKGYLPEEVEASLAAIEEAEARVNSVKEKISYCTVLSPISGTIIHKLVENGEITSLGATIAIISNTEKVKIKGFVSEKDVGVIKLAQTSQIFIDSAPNVPIKGTITFISSEAEFTPKNVQTYNERIKTMYEVVISALNKNGILKSGMPVDVVISRSK